MGGTSAVSVPPHWYRHDGRRSRIRGGGATRGGGVLQGTYWPVEELWVGDTGESVTMTGADEAAQEGRAERPLLPTGNISSSDSWVRSTTATGSLCADCLYFTLTTSIPLSSSVSSLSLLDDSQSSCRSGAEGPSSMLWACMPDGPGNEFEFRALGWGGGTGSSSCCCSSFTPSSLAPCP